MTESERPFQRKERANPRVLTGALAMRCYFISGGRIGLLKNSPAYLMKWLWQKLINFSQSERMLLKALRYGITLAS